MISVKNLTVRFGEQLVLNGIDWFIPPKSRIGLVGDNGAGKTTLLKAVAGILEPDDGSVVMPKDKMKVGYLPQDLTELEDLPLMDLLRRNAGLEALQNKLRKIETELSFLTEGSDGLKQKLDELERTQREFDAKGGYQFEFEAAKTLKGLGFHPEKDAKRKTSEFSGGWKMRIALSSLLLSDPDLLLLDEPTNHLDTESMEWLENWLRDFRGTLLTVSHDRRFLENIASSVAELCGGRLTLYSMDYKSYLQEKEARRKRLEDERARQQEKIEETRRFIERFRYKASKAAQVQSRIKQLEKLELTETAPEHKSVKFSFPEAPRSGLNVITCENLEKSYDGSAVFSGLSFSVQRGERAALVGINGAGKSTLLRLLSRSEEPDKGSITFGLNVKMKYFSQESSQNLDYSRTVWEEVNSTGSALEAPVKRSLLGSFLFSGDDIYKKISVLSGGERSRLGLLKMMLERSNLLILDEPTNHLDIATKELFQQALLSYGGTILIVSHDRAFLDELATRVLEIRDGRLYDYRGNYSWFVERRKLQLETKTEAPLTKKPAPAKTKEQKRKEAEERSRLYRERKTFVGRMEQLEKQIEEDEKLKKELSESLCDPEQLKKSSKVTNLLIELKNCERRLEKNYDEWTLLSEELKKIQ